MSGRFCKNCNLEFDSNAMFCSKCGSSLVAKHAKATSIPNTNTKRNKTFNNQTLHLAMQDKNFFDNSDTYNIQNDKSNIKNTNKGKRSSYSSSIKKSKKYKKLLISGVVVAGILVIGLVGYSIYDNVALKNKANDSKEKQAIKPFVETRDNQISNLSCNFCCKSVVAKCNELYVYCGKDGLYKTDISFENVEKIYDGNCSSVNFFNDKVYFCDINSKSIKEISSNLKDENIVVNDVFKDADYDIDNFAIFDNKLYYLEKDATNSIFKSVNLQDSANQEIYLAQPSIEQYMYFSQDQVIILCKNDSSWKSFKANFKNNNLSLFEDYVSGSDAVKSIGFANNKLYTLSNNSSKGSALISISDRTGNRSEIPLDFEAKKMIVSLNSIFVVSASNDIYFINVNTKIPHKIESDKLLSCDIDNINLLDDGIFVSYSDNSICYLNFENLNIGGN